ncbi:PP2C family protein-serine/threonine phosphatase [Kosakonia cowanii]|uniref:PP2C family protein-serine/threonine phosphatase n=1 Tax=Kosakonia cowanii TaxID=208223 RepID=UPI003B221553
MIDIVSASFFTSSKEFKRTNQDTILPPLKLKDGYLFAIADGLGGYTGGKEASERVISFIRENSSNLIQNNFENLFLDLKEDIKELSENDNKLINAATTLTLCYITDKYLRIGHVGDCRLYIKENNKLKQLTKDHTQHQMLIDDGFFNSRQLKNAKGKNLLTTAISKTIELSYNLLQIPLEELTNENGQFILFLMSDGAHHFWEKRPRFSSNTLSEPSRFCSSLKKRIENGPPIDDYSLIALKVESQQI